MDTTLRSSPFGRAPGRQLPFSTRLNHLNDVPAVFKKTVARLLEGREQGVLHIIYTPEFGTFGEYCPSTLFIVTEHEWLAFASERSGAPTVRYADFSQTRLVEFTLALLQGRIVLEFGDADEQPCVLRFSLTSWEMFRDALFVILSDGAQIKAGDVLSRQLPADFDVLSFGMRSTLQESLIPGDEIRSVVSWSRADVESAGDRMQLHPGGMVLTDRYLCIVTADDPSDRSGPIDLSVYSRGVVFLNRHYPIIGRTTSHDGVDEVAISVGASAQTSLISVLVPRTMTMNIAGIISSLGVGKLV